MKAWYRTRVVVFSETDAFSIYVIKRESQIITATNQSDNIYISDRLAEKCGIDHRAMRYEGKQHPE